jgi:steroid delta-isomerase-like uncharacterized protein
MSLPLIEVIEYERIWVAGLNRGDLSAADQAFAADCVVHITGVPEPLSGVGAWKQFVGGMLAAFPDLQFTVEDQLADADRAAFRWKATGTHTGPLGEATPTGRSVRIDGVIFDRLVNGVVAERWEQWDQPGMLRQLGLM